MDFSKVLPTIRAVAPGVAAALGGPLAGLAVKLLGDALMPGDDEVSPDQIVEAIATGDPEVLLKLKEVEAKLQVELKRLDVDLEKIAAEDRHSARRREVDASDSVTPRLLALLIVLGFFGTLAAMMSVEVPDATKDVMLIMVGSLGAMAAGVVAYYFGSSAGSKAKDGAIRSALGS